VRRRIQGIKTQSLWRVVLFLTSIEGEDEASSGGFLNPRKYRFSHSSKKVGTNHICKVPIGPRLIRLDHNILPLSYACSSEAVVNTGDVLPIRRQSHLLTYKTVPE
jgi:hypothetical protein